MHFYGNYIVRSNRLCSNNPKSFTNSSSVSLKCLSIISACAVYDLISHCSHSRTSLIPKDSKDAKNILNCHFSINSHNEILT